MPKPEEFSPLKMYGRKDVFEKKLNEGYTEISFGGGDWVGNQRIVKLWVFYHPEGKIATFAHPKMFDGVTNVRGIPYEAEYTEREFKKHQKKFQLKVGNRADLAKIVSDWEE